MFPFNSKIKEVDDRRGVDVNNHELKRLNKLSLNSTPSPISIHLHLPFQWEEWFQEEKKNKIKI